MTIIDTLQYSDLLAGFGKGHVEKLAGLCRDLSYKQGEMIFREGDKAGELYILTDGKVALEMEVRPIPDRPGIPTAVEVITKGGAFGWSALVEPHCYTLSARCMTRSTVLAMKGDILRMMMADDTGLGLELMRRVARLISLRLTDTRLRLTSGLGIALLAREIQASE
jgi:CRP/FNR family cyclic AMP-dependent transcriptional regulator